MTLSLSARLLMSRFQMYDPVKMCFEEKLVLLDWSANRSANLILIEKRTPDSAAIIEPVVGSEQIVPVRPESRSVKLVAAGRSHKINLGSSARDRRMSIRSDDCEFT